MLNLHRLAGLLLALVASAAALEPATPAASYAHQSWQMEHGLPQNTVQALAQSADGFLWLGTEVGLVRFDGFTFQLIDHAPLAGADIRALITTPDGTLWTGTAEGLIRLRNGQFQLLTTKDGLPANGIRQLGLDAHGHLLVLTDLGYTTWTGAAFVSEPSEPSASHLIIDQRTRALYVAGDGGLVEISASSFQRTAASLPSHEPIEFAARLVSGSLSWASRSTVAIEHAAHPLLLHAGRELPGTRIQALFADSAGSLWIGTNAGLVRWFAGRLERLSQTDPLASASVLTLLEDREANLWVGTETGGLHILRDQRFRTLGVREGLSADQTTAVVADRHGTLWVGTNGGGLNALSAPRPRVYTVRDGLLSDVILSLAPAPDGTLWIGTPDGLNRIRNGRIDAYTSFDGLPDDFIRSLLVDADGSVWIGTRHGLTHWSGPAANPSAHTQTFTHANGLPSDLVGAMTRDAHGALWVATLAGLTRITPGGIANFTTANGLSSNVVTDLVARPDGSLLIGTQDRGWSLWDGQRFIIARGSPAAANLHAVLDDALGHLWFATANGLARCNCSAMNGQPGCTQWVEFGPADGLRARETAINSHPSAWRSAAGLLYFATPHGLVVVDPAHFSTNTVPPPVVVERFAVDDQEQAAQSADQPLRIPAGHVHFQFDYAGLSFSAPQKVRYRYMLEGFDHGWTEAGTRRTAYYTNIPAGRYVFRVQAANNDGLWNDTGAALRFELRPHFYQTLWFDALLVLALAGLVVLALRLRLRRAEGEFRAVLAERARIAREIHDTLAQGYVGISVQLEVLSALLGMSKIEAASKHLDQIRNYVREGLADARQSIWALRSQDSAETTLPVRLRRLVEAENGHGRAAAFTLFGAYRPLPADTERELLRIAQEALHNIAKHAVATELSVQLEYRPGHIALEVRDNGRGFDASAPSPSGHYGLTGMRERASQIGGQLEIQSAPGQGTSLRLTAPTPNENREKPEVSA